MYKCILALHLCVQVTSNDVCPELPPLELCLLLMTWMRGSHHRPQTTVRHVSVCVCVCVCVSVCVIHANAYANFGLVSDVLQPVSVCGLIVCDREVVKGREK